MSYAAFSSLPLWLFLPGQGWAVAALLSTFTAELPFPLRAAAVIMWSLGDRTGNYTGICSHQPFYIVFAMQNLEEGVLNYLVKYMTGGTKLNNSCFLHWFPVPCCCWLQCVSGHCFVTSYFAFLNQFAFLLDDWPHLPQCSSKEIIFRLLFVCCYKVSGLLCHDNHAVIVPSRVGCATRALPPRTRMSANSTRGGWLSADNIVVSIKLAWIRRLFW